MKKVIILCLNLLILSIFTSCSDRTEAERLYIQASESYAKHDFSSAYNAVNKSIKKDSSFYQAQLLEAKILYFQDKNVESMKILKKTVSRHKEFTEAKLWLVRNYLALEQYDEAEQLLEREISFNQSDWRFYYLYSLLALKQNQMDKRLAMIKKAETYLQDSDKVYIEMSDIWITLGLRNKALDSLDTAEAVSSNPDSIRQIKSFVSSGRDILK